MFAADSTAMSRHGDPIGAKAEEAVFGETSFFSGRSGGVLAALRCVPAKVERTPHRSKCCASLRLTVLEFRRSDWDMPRVQARCAPYRNESAEVAETTPAAHSERHSQ